MAEQFDWYKPEDLPHLFQALQQVPSGGILVGGQSLVFWVDLLGLTLPITDTDYLTYDADVLGSGKDAVLVAEFLRAKAHLPEIHDSTVNSAVINYKTPDGRILHLDFLRSILGPTEAEILADKVIIQHVRYGRITVLHPRHVLISRLANLYTLREKRDSNGITQASVAVEMIRAFIDFHAMQEGRENDDRYYLKWFERLYDIACSDRALLCYDHWGIDVMNAAPIEKIKSAAFHSIRLPQVQAQLEYIRGRWKLNPKRS